MFDFEFTLRRTIIIIIIVVVVVVYGPVASAGGSYLPHDMIIMLKRAFQRDKYSLSDLARTFAEHVVSRVADACAQASKSLATFSSPASPAKRHGDSTILITGGNSQTHTHVRSPARTHASTHARTYARTHTHTLSLTHIHTHTHTQTTTKKLNFVNK